MTQRALVLTELFIAGKRGVCISDLPVDLGYCARNRVSELKRSGWEITSEPCRKHSHAGHIARYTLLLPPGIPSMPRWEYGHPVAL
jgi:hypothetical protein